MWELMGEDVTQETRCVRVCAGVCWKVSGVPTEAVSEGLLPW